MPDRPRRQSELAGEGARATQLWLHQMPGFAVFFEAHFLGFAMRVEPQHRRRHAGIRRGRVVELADTRDLKSLAERCAGSTPALGILALITNEAAIVRQPPHSTKLCHLRRPGGPAHSSAIVPTVLAPLHVRLIRLFQGPMAWRGVDAGQAHFRDGPFGR